MCNLGVHWHDMYDDTLYENEYFFKCLCFCVKCALGFPKVCLDLNLPSFPQQHVLTWSQLREVALLSSVLCKGLWHP